MPLDYTNVIGKPFFDYVKGQLNARAALTSKNDRSNADLLWLTNRNGWLKISSNIDIKEGTPLAKKYGAGDLLAKKYILEGGVIFSSADQNNGSVLRAGVGYDKAYGVGFDPSNPNNMGFKPMPGVTSFNISAEGSFGALKTANIQIKVYDLEQFNIIETLYCHLGYSMLIEYGHVPYIKNDGSLVSTPQTLDFFKLNSKELVASNITSLRSKSFGNYDALFGTVTNYSWTTSNDGSFEISLKVTGPGTVVESLTINYNTSDIKNAITPSNLPVYQEFLKNQSNTESTGSVKDAESAFLPGTIASRNNSILHRHLYSLYENALTSRPVTNNGEGGTGAIDTTTTPTLTGNIFAANTQYPFLKVSPSGITGDYISIRGNNSWVIANGKAGDVPVISGELLRYFTIAYITNPKQSSAANTATSKDQLPSIYIPFGYLLAILQSSGLLYNSDKAKPGETKPFVYIDFNNFTNLCFAYPYSVSVDPTICLININDGKQLNEKLFGGLKAEVPESGSDGWILQPTYAQIKAESKYDPDKDILSKTISNNSLGFYKGGPNKENTGYLMNVLLNIEFIVNTIDTLAGTDDKKEVKVDKFLNAILDGINNATGGVNQFRVAFTDESYCISLYDEQTVEKPEYTTLDILGLRSILHSYSFSSKITPKLSSMLVIGAQATSNKNKQTALDASAIGAWNAYVKDRIMPTKVDSTDGDKSQQAQTAGTSGTSGQEGQAESPDDQLSRLIKGIYQDFKYSADDVDGAKSLLKEKLTAIKANSEDTKALQMIPLEMTIKMDGISGILVNQAFTIPPSRLPMSYRDADNPEAAKFGFVVRKIENSIENNKWFTTFSGQSIKLPAGSVVNTNTKVNIPSNPLANQPAAAPPTIQPQQTTDPTIQKNDNEKTQAVSVSGQNTTPNTYTFIPKNSGKKEVDVFIFYPGIDVAGKVGRDYMPQKIKAGAPDLFDKYVLVFPTTWSTSYSSVKKEYEELLAKAGLKQKTLNIGIYSGSGNNSASVLAAIGNSGKELRNLIIMDPVPSDALINAVKKVQARGGTFTWFYYNPSAWGNASYYTKNIDNLVKLFTNAYKTATPHLDIPSSMISAIKVNLEKGLG